MIGARLSRHYTGERRYRQRDLSRMKALAELTVTMIRPFAAIGRLTAAETALLEAARTIHSYIREDGAGALHLRQSCQLTLEEARNGHH